MLIYKFRKRLDLNLRKLILLLAIFSVSTLFIISLIISYQIVTNQLISNSLALNSNYANKVSLNTNNYFKNMLLELEYSSKVLSKNFDSHELRESETNRLKYQSDHYNSVVISDPQGRLINYSPNVLNIDKNQIQNTPGVLNSLNKKSAYISSPYYSVKNNMIVFISQPIFDSSNAYKGFIGSAIYLREKNIINKVLTTNHNYKNSYIYVINHKNEIIFHPDANRIGQTATGNTGIDYMHTHKNGQIRLINSQGIDNLAGFSHIPVTDWIVVSQQPTHELLKQANSILYKLAAAFFFFYVLIFYIVWKLSNYIASPLNQLANMAGLLNQPEISSKIKEIKPWYYEVTKFKFSLLSSMRKFSQQITQMDNHINTDPLTGLMNRRGMNDFITQKINTATTFSILLIDVDHFKKVNDTYGHDQGDIVLKQVASLMQQKFRKDDLCCRYGGEEFIIIIPNSNPQQVYESAERFRKEVEAHKIDNIGNITISIGIASWPLSSNNIQEVFKIADNNLYKAKNEGRNCVCF
ncbi:sensor domain-containing diguanylate cyclase [Acinetobacter sp. 10FS3-1]|uniref:sensor domain-containing diguanylate cyclase n=2 Tax=Acinetobacter TaxID=469 RepID=UPI00157D2CE6|nr:sensor domain-containing diguanylate cyclase [Acinetobacter sp. 10FS3-1]MDM1780578.1 GGDEF domain-containing protein [Acinetobacter indicus]QKQ69555.1 GGDEF domain-containing protein [Acinetobacter sp. 10FS3-1]